MYAVQNYVTDAAGNACCVCSNCGAFVMATDVIPPNLHCSMCAHMQREKALRIAGHWVPDAPAEILAQFVPPPPDCHFRVRAHLPAGAVVDWLPVGQQRPAPMAPGTCGVVTCGKPISTKATTADYKSGVCVDCRKLVVWDVWRTGIEQIAHCQGCHAWRPAEPWPLEQASEGVWRRKKRCPKHESDYEGEDDKVPDQIDRHNRQRRKHLVKADGAVVAFDGLKWMHGAPREVSDSKKPRCRVADCPQDATWKGMLCERHVPGIFHEEVAASECAHQRRCGRCGGMKNAYGFTWDGRCHQGCANIGGGGRKKQSGGTLPKIRGEVVVGAQWPSHLVPTEAECWQVAQFFDVGLLQAPAPGVCRYQTAANEPRCGAAVAIGATVCPGHLGLVAACGVTGGLRWTCPRCQQEKGLEARGAGVCMACFAADNGTGARDNVNSDAGAAKGSGDDATIPQRRWHGRTLPQVASALR